MGSKENFLQRDFRMLDSQHATVDSNSILLQNQDKMSLVIETISKRKIESSPENNQNLIRLIDFQIRKASNFCSDDSTQIRIFTQRIDKTKSFQTKGRAGMINLYQILNGMQHLSNYTDLPFELTKDMIGMDQNQNLKIWFSKNPSACEPQLPLVRSNELIRKDRQSLTISKLFQNLNCPNYSTFLLSADKPLRYKQLMNRIANSLGEPSLLKLAQSQMLKASRKYDRSQQIDMFINKIFQPVDFAHKNYNQQSQAVVCEQTKSQVRTVLSSPPMKTMATSSQWSEKRRVGGFRVKEVQESVRQRIPQAERVGRVSS